jgi:N-methylhydantoinase B
MPPMFAAMLQPGDVFHHRMAGGGGWGAPSDRERAAVLTDVRDGKVSAGAAREQYGVVA